MLARLAAGRGALVAGAEALQALQPRAYHKAVVDHYERPRNVGSFDKNDENVGTGLVGAPACGVGGCHRAAALLRACRCSALGGAGRGSGEAAARQRRERGAGQGASAAAPSGAGNPLPAGSQPAGAPLAPHPSRPFALPRRT
jgi:hypothetical protein